MGPAQHRRSQEDSWFRPHQASMCHLRNSSGYPAKVPWCRSDRWNCMRYGHTHLSHNNTSTMACLHYAGNRWGSCRSPPRRRLRRCCCRKRDYYQVIRQRCSQMGRKEHTRHCTHHHWPRICRFHRMRLGGWSLERRLQGPEKWAMPSLEQRSPELG